MKAALLVSLLFLLSCQNGPMEPDMAIPAGTIVAFAGTMPPQGWLLCDGAAVSRTEYGTLFSAITIAWGGGDGVTTFNLPDLRGRFLRGADLGTGRDPDRTSRVASNPGGNVGDAVGSVQDHMFASHNHANGAFNQVLQSNCTRTGIQDDSTCGEPNIKESRPLVAAGGNETRPVNAAVNWIIKY